MLGGLAANTTAPGPAPAGNSSAAPCQVRFRELANTGGRPAGSITVKLAAAPRASQPRSIAEPIWPQPTRTSVSAFAAEGAAPSLMRVSAPGQASPIGSVLAGGVAASGRLPAPIPTRKAREKR